MKLKALLSIAVGLVAVFSIQAQDMSASAIENRIKPVGKVHVAGAAAAVAAGPRSGADIYNKSCVACHAVGLLGAPKPGVATQWQPRLDAKGFDTVWANAIKGINAMPPRGTCADCSDDEIKAAIEFMLEGI